MRARGELLILGAAVLWGTTGTAQALGTGGNDPLAVGAVRLILGAAGLIAVAALMGDLRPSGPVPWRALLPTAMGIAAYQLAFFGAVARTGVALGTVVAIGSSPVLAGLLAGLLERERLTRPWFVATLLAVGGTALIAGPHGYADPGGILLALAAGASYAIYALGSKRLLAALRPLTAMALGFGGGAALLLPVLAAVDLHWLAKPSGAAAGAWLGVVTVTAAYVLFGHGLRLIPVSTTATLSLAEPVTATLLGVVLLRERPTATAWLGVGAVLVGLMVLAVSTPRRPAAPLPPPRAWT